VSHRAGENRYGTVTVVRRPHPLPHGQEGSAQPDPSLVRRCATCVARLTHEPLARPREVAQLQDRVGGTKLGRTNPCASRSAIHTTSFTSVLRTSALRTCTELASTNSHALSSACGPGPHLCLPAKFG
jgi:hypothetical protein